MPSAASVRLISARKRSIECDVVMVCAVLIIVLVLANSMMSLLIS
ncbi:MAG: hypothetical protein QOK44_4880 [Betaproteobacteria bacterium]|nr:hypothetical protein [Betaproteobacteria bacterium]